MRRETIAAIAGHLLAAGAGSAQVTISTGEIAEATGLAQRTVITALQVMEGEGLITRDGGQGRRARIALVATCDRLPPQRANDHKLPDDDADEEGASYNPITRRRTALGQRMVDMYRTGRRFPSGWAEVGGYLLGRYPQEALSGEGRRALALYEDQVDESADCGSEQP